MIHGNGNGIETFHEVSRRLAAAGWPPGVDAKALESTTSFASNHRKEAEKIEAAVRELRAAEAARGA